MELELIDVPKCMKRELERKPAIMCCHDGKPWMLGTGVQCYIFLKICEILLSNLLGGIGFFEL